ncbi:hypothetical protein DFS34DRAFT_621859 [Phlyctochytrium arcticum]|nr:hypothetical protein DFS34DRAFT_621859 [Phlyctochytrium arcticum]
MGDFWKPLVLAPIVLTLAYHAFLYTVLGRRVTRSLLLTLLELLPEPFPRSAPFAKRILKKHGGLDRLADNLWIVIGELPNIEMLRTMPVYRAPETNDLLIFSPMCCTEEVMKEIEGLGTVKWIYVPCSWHTLDAGAYKERYPNAKLVAPRKAVEAVEKKSGHEVAVAEEVFGLWSKGTPADRTSGSTDPLSKAVRLVFPQGQAAVFDEAELLVPLSSADSQVVSHALLVNDMFHREKGHETTNPKMTVILMVDKMAEFRAFIKILIHDIVSKENVKVMTMSHGTPVLGSKEVRRQIELGSVPLGYKA